MAFSGDWKKVSTTGAEEFFAAHEVKPENAEKLKKSALAEMITHMKDNGSSLTFSRTLTLDGWVIVFLIVALIRVKSTVQNTKSSSEKGRSRI